MTERLGLIKVSVHSLERALERFNLEAEEFRDLLYNVIKKKPLNGNMIKHGNKRFVFKKIDGYYKLVTVMINRETKIIKHTLYVKGKKRRRDGYKQG